MGNPLHVPFLGLRSDARLAQMFRMSFGSLSGLRASAGGSTRTVIATAAAKVLLSGNDGKRPLHVVVQLAAGLYAPTTFAPVFDGNRFTSALSFLATSDGPFVETTLRPGYSLWTSEGVATYIVTEVAL